MKRDAWAEDRAAVLARLRRAEGQVRGVQAMIERDVDCEQIAQQLAAARKALDRAFHELIGCAMKRDIGSRAGTRERVAAYTRLLAKYA